MEYNRLRVVTEPVMLIWLWWLINYCENFSFFGFSFEYFIHC
jgi:hypothetical protein